MSSHSHPTRESPDWKNPDYCPFCGAELTSPGTGFMDHIEENDVCRERFEAWREAIAGDIEADWEY